MPHDNVKLRGPTVDKASTAVVADTSVALVTAATDAIAVAGTSMPLVSPQAQHRPKQSPPSAPVATGHAPHHCHLSVAATYARLGRWTKQLFVSSSYSVPRPIRPLIRC